MKIKNMRRFTKKGKATHYSPKRSRRHVVCQKCGKRRDECRCKRGK